MLRQGCAVVGVLVLFLLGGRGFGVRGRCRRGADQPDADALACEAFIQAQGRGTAWRQPMTVMDTCRRPGRGRHPRLRCRTSHLPIRVGCADLGGGVVRASPRVMHTCHPQTSGIALERVAVEPLISVSAALPARCPHCRARRAAARLQDRENMSGRRPGTPEPIGQVPLRLSPYSRLSMSRAYFRASGSSSNAFWICSSAFSPE